MPRHNDNSVISFLIWFNLQLDEKKCSPLFDPFVDKEFHLALELYTSTWLAEIHPQMKRNGFWEEQYLAEKLIKTSVFISLYMKKFG